MGVTIIREDQIKRVRTFINNTLDILLSLNPFSFGNIANIYATTDLGNNLHKFFYETNNLNAYVQFQCKRHNEWFNLGNQKYVTEKQNYIILNVNSELHPFIRFKTWKNSQYEVLSNEILLGTGYLYNLEDYTVAPHQAGESQIFFLDNEPDVSQEILVYLNGILLSQNDISVVDNELTVTYPNNVAANYTVQVFYSSQSSGYTIFGTAQTDSFSPESDIEARMPWNVHLSYTPKTGTHIFVHVMGINISKDNISLIGNVLTVILDYKITSNYKMEVRYYY